MAVVHHIFSRLRTEQDEENDVKILLNLIAAHVSVQVSVLEQVLDCASISVVLTPRTASRVADLVYAMAWLVYRLCCQNGRDSTRGTAQGQLC